MSVYKLLASYRGVIHRCYCTFLILLNYYIDTKYGDKKSASQSSSMLFQTLIYFCAKFHPDLFGRFYENTYVTVTNENPPKISHLIY